MKNFGSLYYKSLGEFLRSESIAKIRSLEIANENLVNRCSGVRQSIDKINRLLESPESLDVDVLNDQTASRFKDLSELLLNLDEFELNYCGGDIDDFLELKKWIGHEMLLDQVEFAQVRLTSITQRAIEEKFNKKRIAQKQERVARWKEKNEQKLNLIYTVYAESIKRCSGIDRSIKNLVSLVKCGKVVGPPKWYHELNARLEALTLLLKKIEILDSNLQSANFQPYFVFKEWVFSTMEISQIDSAYMQLSKIEEQWRLIKLNEEKKYKIQMRLKKIQDYRTKRENEAAELKRMNDAEIARKDQEKRDIEKKQKEQKMNEEKRRIEKIIEKERTHLKHG